ncbi:hypothetical protein L0657_06645 [Dyadobacter sp. CY345]|uniref:hypothetical protein n=1 Tax=Dyadobacter sp. CY345 TaxID=2909335 RepID=UPI001F1E7989|nr:hypothetical protein [Dyadobacter sp. CY345]MCF2443628.1 hypothetical protein [Dyadobacter sp. CY345]
MRPKEIISKTRIPEIVVNDVSHSSLHATQVYAEIRSESPIDITYVIDLSYNLNTKNPSASSDFDYFLEHYDKLSLIRIDSNKAVKIIETLKKGKSITFSDMRIEYGSKSKIHNSFWYDAIFSIINDSLIISEIKIKQPPQF